MTKEEKEAKSNADFQDRLARLRMTVPASDQKLAERIAAVPLAPDNTPSKTVQREPEQTEPVVGEAPRPLSPATAEGLIDRDQAETDLDEVVEPPAIVPAALPEPRAVRSMARLYSTGDLKHEQMLDLIAQHVKSRRKEKKLPARRVAINIDSDVFSRVSHVAMSRGLDKGEVLSYLLARYLPKAGIEENDVPPYMVQERSDEVLNSNHLFYAEDENISARFNWLMQRFGLLKVDIVGNIVLRYLPASPFRVPPKRKPRRKRF